MKNKRGTFRLSIEVLVKLIYGLAFLLMCLGLVWALYGGDSILIPFGN